MLVSIIMPSYNSSPYIADSIESILNQTYSNWELLITDDCSTDETVEIIGNYMNKDERIKLYRHDINKGAGYARNNSIHFATGRFFAFLDSDDIWVNEKLEKQIKFMIEKDLDMSYSFYQKFNAAGFNGIVKSRDKITYNKLLYSNVIGCLTVIYDASKLGKRYMPLLRKRQDMALWLDILKDTDKIRCLEEVLAYYRTDSGMTANKLKVLKHQWLFYRQHLKMGRVKTGYYFFFYALNGFLKYIS